MARHTAKIVHLPARDTKADTGYRWKDRDPMNEDSTAIMARRSIDWIVSVEQRQPFESTVIEVFSEEDDALRYAGLWAASRPCHQVSKRVWQIIADDGPANKLIVWKRART